jgi:hypothetical protein
MDWLTTACGYEWPKERRFFSSTHIHTYIHTYSYDRANNFVIEEIGDGSTATTELIIFSCHVHIVNQVHASRSNVLSSDFSVEWQKARYLSKIPTYILAVNLYPGLATFFSILKRFFCHFFYFVPSTFMITYLGVWHGDGDWDCAHALPSYIS